MNDYEKFALVGNYFKPSAFLVAVLGDTHTGLRTFLSDAPFAPQQCKPLSLEDMKKCHSQLINEVEALCRTEPILVSRIHRTIIPVGYEFLLREDFDAKLRIFCQAPVSYPDVLKRAFKLHDIPQHVLNQVSKKQEPVSGITAIADQKYVKKLAVAVSLAELPCIELTEQNIRMLPDPVGTLQAQTLGTGLQFVQAAKEHVNNLSSHLEKIGASFLVIDETRQEIKLLRAANCRQIVCAYFTKTSVRVSLIAALSIRGATPYCLQQHALLYTKLWRIQLEVAAVNGNVVVAPPQIEEGLELKDKAVTGVLVPPDNLFAASSDDMTCAFLKDGCFSTCRASVLDVATVLTSRIGSFGMHHIPKRQVLSIKTALVEILSNAVKETHSIYALKSCDEKLLSCLQAPGSLRAVLHHLAHPPETNEGLFTVSVVSQQTGALAKTPILLFILLAPQSQIEQMASCSLAILIFEHLDVDCFPILVNILRSAGSAQP